MTKTKLRIPPQNIDAEKALLGSVLIKSESLYEILEDVNIESFYSDRHKIIFEAVLDLFNKNQPIDLLTIVSVLRDKGNLEAVGGEAYIAELTTTVPSAANADYYSKIVQEKYIKRRLIQASEKIAEIGFKEGEEVEHSIDEAENGYKVSVNGKMYIVATPEEAGAVVEEILTK